ncbi:MAG: radical SAM protein [Thermodesulfobacteriota bacterium]
MNQFKIRRILIEKEAENDTLSKNIIEKMPNTPVQIVASSELALGEDIEAMDKDTLRLTHYKGEFLKPCPGTRRYICCGYQILNVGINCPMECSYCFLQSYINQPSLRIFSNLEDEIHVIGEFIDNYPNRIFRIGTGEFTDSLALNYITGWTDFLLPFFSHRKNSILELKTKTAFIQDILENNQKKRIVVAWSLNTPRIIANEEKKTATLKERILSARECQKAGFVVAFHFDPLIHYSGWEKEYQEIIQLLERYIDPSAVIWISIGSFRYMPDLKWHILKRFPHTRIFDGEFITGLDGKLRYFKPIRIQMYAQLSERLTKWYDDLGIYLCMESDDIWQESLGWSPKSSSALANYLDDRVRKLMPI